MSTNNMARDAACWVGFTVLFAGLLLAWGALVYVATYFIIKLLW